ncbi:MAG: pseudouridine synthase [Planctomycetota bacterium]
MPRSSKQSAKRPRPDDDRGERLQKVLAAAGVASRRHAEELIEQGLVRVNGETVRTLPVFVDPTNDRIEVDGRPLPARERHVYIMLYKPKQTMCTLDDPEGRRTVADVVKHPSGLRLYPVGRLDYDTLGLVLMTNDGELANRLTHPRFGVHKTYRAIVKGALEQEDVDRLKEGIYLADRRGGKTVGGKRTGDVEIEIVRKEPERTHLDITLGEGRNRQVRRMLAKVDCHVKKLTRIEMGPISLKGLAIGEWRELTPIELRKIRIAAKRGKTRRLSVAERTERAMARQAKTRARMGGSTVPNRPGRKNQPKRFGSSRKGPRNRNA